MACVNFLLASSVFNPILGLRTGCQFFTETFTIDAIYFAIGTLTTAGTGNISATSETARGIQTMQMILGLVLITFAVTIVIGRLSSGSRLAADHLVDGQEKVESRH